MNRTLPQTRYRAKPESALLENLIDPIDRLTESVFSILILLTITMTSWIISLSGNSEHSLDSENIVDLVIAALPDPSGGHASGLGKGHPGFELHIIIFAVLCRLLLGKVYRGQPLEDRLDHFVGHCCPGAFPHLVGELIPADERTCML
jgi:hypothetical protein